MADRLELLELGDDVLYFDEPCPPRVAAQIDAAAHDYGQPVAEQRPLYAYLAPEQLSVLVAFYRYWQSSIASTHLPPNTRTEKGESHGLRQRHL